jgi:hypothetical protein
MSDQQPDPVPRPDAVVRRERRAYVRLETDLPVTCRPKGRKIDVGWPGRVRDISQGGIGLLLRHRFESGTVLIVELRGSGGPLARAMTLRVVHATAVMDGATPSWLHGCAFDQLLGPAEIEALA